MTTLFDALRGLAARTRLAVKAGRTHLMDATPVTHRPGGRRLGRVDRARARAFRRRPRRARRAPLGGTAVGTGINAPGRLRHRDRSPRLAARDRLRLAHRPPTRWSTRAARARSPRRRAGSARLAVALTKIANDIRLLASGPAARARRAAAARAAARFVDHAGQGQPGAVRVGEPGGRPRVRQRRHVGYAASQGILELNTYLPVMADALLESGTLLGNVARVFAEQVCRRHRGRRERVAVGTPNARRRWRPRSTRSSATSEAAEIVKRAQAEDRSIIDVVIDEGVLPGRRGPPHPRSVAGRRTRPRLTRRRSP